MANSKFILPLFYKELNDATASWTDEEFGAYLRLLIHQWSNSCIPKDMNRLKRIAESIEKHWALIGNKFEETDTGLQNIVMENIRNERQDFYKKQLLNGSKGGNPNFKKGAKNPYYSKDKSKQADIFLDNNQDVSNDQKVVINQEKKITQDNPKDNPLNNPTHYPKDNPTDYPTNITSYITDKEVIFSKNGDISQDKSKKITQDNPEDNPTHYPTHYPKDNPLTLTLNTNTNNTNTNNSGVFDEIKKFFSFEDEIKFAGKWFEINAFLNELSKEKKIEHFKQQFDFYKKYKKASGEKTHGFKSFINGEWDAENWESKFDSFKKSDTKKSQPININEIKH